MDFLKKITILYIQIQYILPANLLSLLWKIHNVSMNMHILQSWVAPPWNLLCVYSTLSHLPPPPTLSKISNGAADYSFHTSWTVLCLFVFSLLTSSSFMYLICFYFSDKVKTIMRGDLENCQDWKHFRFPFGSCRWRISAHTTDFKCQRWHDWNVAFCEDNCPSTLLPTQPRQWIKHSFVSRPLQKLGEWFLITVTKL